MANRRGTGAPARPAPLLGLAAAVVVGLVATSAGATADRARPNRMLEGLPLVESYAATVVVDLDGSLDVAETFRLSGGGPLPLQEFERSIVTREQYDADNDRSYDVTGIEASVNGVSADPAVTMTDDITTIAFTSTVDDGGLQVVEIGYTVSGAVAQTPDGLEVRWPVLQGLDLPVARARVSWNAPGVIWLSCLAGAPGSSRPCSASQLVDTPVPVMTQLGLEPGEQVVGILGLSADSGVSANVELRARWSLERAFTSSGIPLAVSLLVLVLGLLGAFALWWTRGRDAPAESEDTEAVGPFTRQDHGDLALTPPGGARPGQLGTLVDERADVIDVSATLIDLATRNYLFVEELARGSYGRLDWLLRKRNGYGDELLGYERDLLDTVFSAGDEVLASALPEVIRDRLAGIQSAMYDDMVAQGWFAQRPDAVRSRWTTAGWVLVAAGLVLTVVLALTGTYGLVGVAVILAGVALAGAGQLAPARTLRGSRLLGELERFRDWLAVAEIDQIPAEQREVLISRLYPYAVVFGLGERWADALSGLDDDPDPDAPLHWYGAPSDWHLSDAAPSLQHLVVTLNAGFGSRRLFADRA